MNTPIRPGGVASPAAAYELAMHVAGPGEMIFTAGIVGTRADGTIADEVGEQAAEAWRTVAALLGERGFGAHDIVSYTTYVVAGHDLGAVMAARDEFLDGHRAASTLIPVPELAQPQWKVEVAVVAART
jgi:enamine deaminase RidA (YjgF/YER057c/UK114 family)